MIHITYTCIIIYHINFISINDLLITYINNIKYNKFIEYIKYSSNPLIINTIFLILLL